MNILQNEDFQIYGILQIECWLRFSCISILTFSPQDWPYWISNMCVQCKQHRGQ